jgi:hypothetical protein
LAFRCQFRRGWFTSVRQLTDTIGAFIEHWNDHPRPFAWTKDADEIVARIGRANTKLRRTLKAPGRPLGFALKEPYLPFIPGSQALKGAGPVLLAQPCQCRQHDGADDHPLLETAASQHMHQRSPPDQPQRRLIIRTRGLRTPRRPAAACLSHGFRRPVGLPPWCCHFAPRLPCPA